jgi:hypothetical protein
LSKREAGGFGRLAPAQLRFDRTELAGAVADLGKNPDADAHFQASGLRYGHYEIRRINV